MTALIPQTVPLSLSGERFSILYRLGGSDDEARAPRRDICLEQTVEFPEDLVPAGPIRDEVVGRIECFESLPSPSGRGAGGEGHLQFHARISFPVETAGDDLSQLLNVVLGNISLKPAIRAEALDLPPSLLGRFRGPRLRPCGAARTDRRGGPPALIDGAKADGPRAGRSCGVGLSLRDWAAST